MRYLEHANMVVKFVVVVENCSSQFGQLQSVQLGECLDLLHGGLDVALPHTGPHHHVHAPACPQ